MKKAQTQADIVNNYPKLGTLGSEVKEELTTPGIKELHLRSKDEIAEVLTQILKSRRDIVGLHWRFGEKFELVFRNDPL